MAAGRAWRVLVTGGAGFVGSAFVRRLLLRDPERMVPDADRMVSRLWAIYYPALALKRVPAVLPHENGAILLRCVFRLICRFATPETASRAAS